MQEGLTPLHCAAFAGGLDLCEYLVQKGAGIFDITVLRDEEKNLRRDLSVMSIQRWIPNDDARSRRYLHEQDRLSAIHSQPKLEHYGQETALHFAAWGRDRSVCRYFIEQGLDVNARDIVSTLPSPVYVPLTK